MSQVHKSERGESRFEVMENALKLKRQLRELDYIRNYGHIALLRKRKILRCSTTYHYVAVAILFKPISRVILVLFKELSECLSDDPAD